MSRTKSGNPEVRIDIGLDVGSDASRPPGGEAAPQSVRHIPSLSLPAAANLQQLCRLLQAGLGRLTVAVESHRCRGNELDERFVAAKGRRAFR
jgi:hypothetical protein